MFFKNKQLEKRVADLEEAVYRMSLEQGANDIRLSAITKLYPHGIKKNGEPRNKAGRPRKVVTV
jgi:hypothetical protein